MATLMKVFVEAAENPSVSIRKQLLRPGKQSVQHRERESGRENHGCFGLHQRHDRHLCAQHIHQKINGISLPIVLKKCPVF